MICVDMAATSGWAVVDDLPVDASVGVEASNSQNQATSSSSSKALGKPKLPVKYVRDYSDDDFSSAKRRISAVVAGLCQDRAKFPALSEPEAAIIFDTFSASQISAVAFNAIRPHFLEWMDEYEIDWVTGAMEDVDSVKTGDPGVYLWQVGHDLGLRPISGMPKPVRYQGAAWGAAGLWQRISRRQNHGHRLRYMAKSKMLIYEYLEGIHGERKGSRFAAFATLKRDKLSVDELKGWCVILETLGMVLNQTFDTEHVNGIEAFRKMYLPDMGTSPYLGANRSASVRKFQFATADSKNPGYQPVLTKVEKLLRAYYSQGTVLTRAQKEVMICPSTRNRATPIVYLAKYNLGIPPTIIDRYGLRIGDTVTLTLDIHPDGPHPHPWIDVELTKDEAPEALRLGICISGTTRRQGSARDSPPPGQHFSHWIERQINGLYSGVTGHPSCNAAMSIIEWMRGEMIVPVPDNRTVIGEGNMRLNNYYGITADAANQSRKREHQSLSSGDGKLVLEKFEAAKAGQASMAEKPRKRTKREKELDEMNPATVVGYIDD